ncbi:MAG: hypothetical protein DRR19_29245 [Candidatus Parabeggiatoa sp. nov. 1]|nr:MAG: hypothetical protein DRR19_29245 [Gammaproteobacteria bacterium]
MGVALYNILAKPSVTKVTLVEIEPKVIELLKQAAQFEQWIGIEKLCNTIYMPKLSAGGGKNFIF